MTERSDRMEFLLRRNAGHRRLPYFFATLGGRLDSPIADTDVLPLERGDMLWKVLYGEFSAAWKQRVARVQPLVARSPSRSRFWPAEFRRYHRRSECPLSASGLPLYRADPSHA